ncbi:MAG: glycosyltransferase family 39 protein, partial [Chloroflexi bacterium]|nr:glycosyltransferase family 39 protein [Chloroflexota bacterium]
MNTSRLTLIILLALCLLAFALGIYRLGAQGLWFDEGESVWVPAQGLTSIAPIMAIRGLPPLYFYVVWAAVPLIGQSEFALRFISLFFGVLLVPLTFVLARRLYSERVGRWAALLAAISPFVAYYDQEARMYTMLAVPALLSMLAFARILQARRATWRWAIVYVLATTAGLYTYYYTLFVVAAQGLFLLLRWQRYRSLLVRGLALLALVGLLFVPWAIAGWATIAGRMGSAFDFTPLTPWDLAGQTLTAFGVGLTMPDALAAALVTLVASVLALFGLWDQRRGESGLLLALWLGVAFAGSYVVNLRTPWVHPRYLMLAFPAFVILTARGLTMLTARRRGRFVAIAAALIIVLGSAA